MISRGVDFLNNITFTPSQMVIDCLAYNTKKNNSQRWGGFMKLLLMTFILVLGSCKNTELATISHGLSNLEKSTATNQRTTNNDANDSSSDSSDSLPDITCEKYCSDKNHFEEIEDNGFSYLSFPNFGYNGVGKCRGHALLTQKMTFLAKFDESPGCDLEESTCLDIYRKGIYKIKKYGTFKIKGFKNLLEFSSHHKIKPILRNIVKYTPHRYKTGVAYIENPIYPTKEENNFYEIKRRLTLGHYPYVGIFGPKTGNHGLIAYEDTFKGSQNIICAKDPNIILDNAENCDNYFYLEEGQIYYKRLNRDEDKLSKFNLTGDEDKRVEKYRKALTKNCIQESRAQNLCK